MVFVIKVERNNAKRTMTCGC